MTTLHWLSGVFAVVYLVVWAVFVLAEPDDRIRPPSLPISGENPHGWPKIRG